MNQINLDYIADMAGRWTAPFLREACEALRAGRILPPRFMLIAASQGDQEAVRSCVEWVLQVLKMEYTKESMRIIVEDERRRLRAIAKQQKASVTEGRE